jgi:hypothetical protein
MFNNLFVAINIHLFIYLFTLLKENKDILSHCIVFKILKGSGAKSLFEKGVYIFDEKWPNVKSFIL